MFGIELFSVQLLNGYYFQTNHVYVQMDRRSTRNNLLFSPNMTTNFFSRILIIRGITFKFEYLEFIFKYNLGFWSGDQELDFDEKNECRKFRASVPLSNPYQTINYKPSFSKKTASVGTSRSYNFYLPVS
jgi:hypothetical protein